MSSKVLAKLSNITEEEWKALRRKGIGGSDAPAIVGANPYRSVFELWLDKLGKGEEVEDNPQMKWGRIIEPMLAEEWMKLTGKKLRRKNAILQSKVYPYLLANVDRMVVGENAGWEGKTTNFFYQEIDGKPPLYYMVQCQHYMLVTGTDRWYLSVLAGGQKEYHYAIARDDTYIDEILLPNEIGFWHNVENETPPDIDGSKACGKYLEQQYSEATDEEIELPENYYDLLKKYDDLREKKNKVETEIEYIANQIKNEMGDASRASLFDRKVRWINVVTNRFDAKKLEAEMPDIHQKYLKESKYRRFQIS